MVRAVPFLWLEAAVIGTGWCGGIRGGRAAGCEQITGGVRGVYRSRNRALGADREGDGRPAGLASISRRRARSAFPRRKSRSGEVVVIDRKEQGKAQSREAKAGLHPVLKTPS